MNCWFGNLSHISALSVILLSVTACGGGGSGDDSSPNPNPNPVSAPDPISSDPDSFSKVFVGDQINPNNWVYLHFVKKVDNGQRVSEITQRGTNGSNYDFLSATDGQLNSFQVDTTVTEIRGDVNGQRGSTAGIVGSFYKDTTMPGRTGEISAHIEITNQENSDSLVVNFSVTRCQDADCTNVENLFFERISQGFVTAGQPHKLSVEYDQTARSITFRVDNKTVVFDNAPVFAANSENQGVWWGTWIEHIDKNATPAQEGFVAALFDNLFIDGILIQAFENSEADLSIRTVRRLRNGVVELDLARKGENDNAQFLALQVVGSTQVTSSIKAKVFDIEGAAENGATALFGMEN